MSGSDITRGERGMKGDHGQHGDTGDTGITGLHGVQGERGDTGGLGNTGERGPTGDPGATGLTGQTGLTGARGPSQRLPYVLLGLFVIGVLAWSGYRDREQQEAVAKTVRQNCEQIELVKSQIRGTVESSIARLPTIAYYRQHPGELEQAVRDAQRSVERFAAVDCRSLPAVRSVTPPPK